MSSDRSAGTDEDAYEDAWYRPEGQGAEVHRSTEEKVEPASERERSNRTNR